MSYQVQGQAFNTRTDAINHIMFEFVTASGLNSPKEIMAAIETPVATAQELLESYGQPELTGAQWDEFAEEWSHEPEFANLDELAESIQGLEKSA